MSPQVLSGINTRDHPVGPVVTDKLKLSGGLYQRGGKRLLDLTIALMILPFVAPLIFLLWVLVKCDGGPGFFAHMRVGRNGQMFRCRKLRTMVPDAAERLKICLAQDPAKKAEWQAHFKLRDDPRVTAFGLFLRRSSFDELPQIWNVLKGEMSLVGPRPVVAEELQRYGRFQPLYLAVRPGVTGLWQVSGRNALSYGERVRLDARYVREKTLFRDLSILLKTAAVVVKRTGI